MPYYVHVQTFASGPNADTKWFDLHVYNNALDLGHATCFILPAVVPSSPVNITLDTNGDGKIDATDQYYTALGPVGLNVEGDGPRTLVTLSINTSQMSPDEQAAAIAELPPVAGVVFYANSTITTAMTLDSSDNILTDKIATSPYYNQFTDIYTRTLYVSLDPNDSSAWSTSTTTADSISNGLNGDTMALKRPAANECSPRVSPRLTLQHQ